MTKNPEKLHDYFIAGHTLLTPAQIEEANRVVEANLKLAGKAAWLYRKTGIDPELLESYGMEALMIGSRVHDPKRGRLSTIVMLRMKQLVGRHFAELKAVKRGGSGHRKQVEPVKTYQQGIDRSGMQDDVPDDAGRRPDAIAQTNDEIKQLLSAMDQLSHREKQVLKARFYEDLTLDETGQIPWVQLTKERVRQIEVEALEKLRLILFRKKIRTRRKQRN